METLCKLCRDGPSGFDGHADLGVQTIGNMFLSFSCRGCATRWSRTGLGHGKFAWDPMAKAAAAGASTGTLVPPRSPGRYSPEVTAVVPGVPLPI